MSAYHTHAHAGCLITDLTSYISHTGPEFLFKTFVAVKFVDDDDDDTVKHRKMADFDPSGSQNP